MTGNSYDVIIVGSGAGGASAAYRLAKAGKRVLLVEKGGELPRDGSTLDVKKVFVEGLFKTKDAWVDAQGEPVHPDEFNNVGGKTKWYGAALLRFRPEEFEAEPDFQYLAWPFGYETIEPYYDKAEALLDINHFPNEPHLQALLDRITKHNPAWQPESLPLGLKTAVLKDTKEAKHFDGFASACGYKSDAEWNLIDLIRDEPNFTLLMSKPVEGLLHADGHVEHITGVRLADGTSHTAPIVVLAAGAMSSPRILEDYLAETGLGASLPCAKVVGTNFRLHINSAVLGFGWIKDTDVLRKTAILFNDAYPHSSIQCLGWIDGEVLGAQLPAAMPQFVDNALGAHAIGFFAITEDGSSPQNRIVSGGKTGPATMDYSLDRIEAARDEHEASLRAFLRALLEAGLPGAQRYSGLAGTAHAAGTLVTGTDPATSVVDANGKVHGLEGLYVGDGSILPRSSRVNPSLTIYAWGLRLGDHLAALS